MPRRYYRKRRSRKPSSKQPNIVLRTVVFLIVVIWIIVGAAVQVPGLWRWLVLVAGILVLTPIILLLRRQIRRRALTSEIGQHLRSALEAMDSTARWYTDEQEANKELVACLKAKGISDVRYQCRLPDGETADARVGNILIEGKLSPGVGEVDRLMGQLTRYTQYGHRVNIVIYGPLDKHARNRIEREIQSRYPKRVFLTYLPHPKRRRVQVQLASSSALLLLPQT